MHPRGSGFSRVLGRNLQQVLPDQSIDHLRNRLDLLAAQRGIIVAGIEETPPVPAALWIDRPVVLRLNLRVKNDDPVVFRPFIVSGEAGEDVAERRVIPSAEKLK
jgi:hypothetical protein